MKSEIRSSMTVQPPEGSPRDAEDGSDDGEFLRTIDELLV